MSKIEDFFKKLGKNIVESADAANPEYKRMEKTENKPVETVTNEPTPNESASNKYVPGYLLEDLTGDDEDTLDY